MATMDGMTMSMTMDMSTTMASATATTTSAVAATTTAMSMGGMDMGSMDMGDEHACKISMLWNWNTVDACFLSTSWHIQSKGMFAGSCVGVVLLAVLLELLRRSVKEYDRYLVGEARDRDNFQAFIAGTRNTTERGHPAADASDTTAKPGQSFSESSIASSTVAVSGYRPKIYEQALRALLHTAQFVVAYFLMLLAMYYNGYFIICIFIGSYIGAFIFQWERLGVAQQTSAAQEATVCCG
ncbi:hypothetical protein M426DRAFT_323561 [Hypoxylon sp. CI-4A]|nr:hypothetical protein M426DRAFT_323561 [Hypoxylon sp. CI-4A]